MLFSFDAHNYRGWSIRQKADYILERSKNREYFYELFIKMVSVVIERDIRMIIENPWSMQHYLKANGVIQPKLIDNNRMLRGDHYVKPTAYWFINCDPKVGLFTEQNDKEKKIVAYGKHGIRQGMCSEERSMISPDYARNFICDFILGKEQEGTQLSIF